MERLREFFDQEGEAVTFSKGELLECEGEPAKWIAYVERGCFKYMKRGVSDDKAHITWFSFEGSFVRLFVARHLVSLALARTSRSIRKV